MAGAKIPRVDLPPGLRLDTLAVREGLPPSAWGENSEALFLTSSFVQPDAGDGRGPLRQRGRGVHLLALHQPDGDHDGAPARRARRHRGLYRDGERHGGDPDARAGLAEGGRPRRLLAERVRLDDPCSSQEFAKFGVETSFVSQTDSAQWRAAISRTRGFSSPRRRPIRSPRSATSRALAGIAHARRRAARRSTTASARRPCSGRSSYGADIVMHSGTKYLDGQGRVIAGAALREREVRRTRVHAGDAQRRHDACRRSMPGSC